MGKSDVPTMALQFLHFSFGDICNPYPFLRPSSLSCIAIASPGPACGIALRGDMMEIELAG